MTLEQLKESVPEQTNQSVGLTNVRLDSEVVTAIKKEVNVSQNTQVAPAVAVAIAEYIGDDDMAEEYEEQFREQFED